VLLEHRHAGDDARLAAGGQGVQLEVGGDERRGELGVGGGAGVGAPDIGGYVVQLLAVLTELAMICDPVCDGTLSATMSPAVARVSAAMMTPPSNRQPTMVVPVLVARGAGTPLAAKAALRLWLLKSKPAMWAVERLL
jgi:hypothetical protein